MKVIESKFSLLLNKDSTKVEPTLLQIPMEFQMQQGGKCK